MTHGCGTVDEHLGWGGHNRLDTWNVKGGVTRVQTAYRLHQGCHGGTVNKSEHLEDEALVMGGVRESRSVIHMNQGGQVPVITVRAPGRRLSEGMGQDRGSSKAGQNGV